MREMRDLLARGDAGGMEIEETSRAMENRAAPFLMADVADEVTCWVRNGLEEDQSMNHGLAYPLSKVEMWEIGRISMVAASQRWRWRLRWRWWVETCQGLGEAFRYGLEDGDLQKLSRMEDRDLLEISEACL